MPKLGATSDRTGVTFALLSNHATAVDLCLFASAADATESTRVAMTRGDNGIWHVDVRGALPGQIYGFSVDGPKDLARGHRFDPARILFDPYARVVGRTSPTPLAAVADESFDWQDDRRPATPWRDTVIYELHVKGVTALHPLVPSRLRGTYLGLIEPAVITHLKRMNVTAIELMPIHFHVDEPAVIGRGLVNYWGYNTLGYFAPDPRFALSPHTAVSEFKTMIRGLHAAGFEVILDVVYNHTAEGDPGGPTLAFRGIDNAGYYRLRAGDPALYEDFTGCGNTLNMAEAPPRALVMDSLRYWATEMHVDGFRFDLASALTRAADGGPDTAFFKTIREDPALTDLKLIAEPWDATADGYLLGGFPPGWAEWNGRYRDAGRRFWRGDTGALPELATRLAGSRDLFGHAGRMPQASINFVTSHDGFTLADLTAYSTKYNEANGEGNRDGEQNNFSFNCGVEGPTDDAAVLALRDRQRLNFMVTLAISQGVPMLSGGDEMGRSQAGNNNAYCQDGPVSWTPWAHSSGGEAFLQAVCRVLALRKDTPALRRESFLSGDADVHWLTPDGPEMSDPDWQDAERRAFGMLLDGEVLVWLNAGQSEVRAVVPESMREGWVCRMDTATPDKEEAVEAARNVAPLSIQIWTRQA